MRSYILTEKEHEELCGFLEGGVKRPESPAISVIKCRAKKNINRLRNHIGLLEQLLAREDT